MESGIPTIKCISVPLAEMLIATSSLRHDSCFYIYVYIYISINFIEELGIDGKLQQTEGASIIVHNAFNT